MCKPLIGVTAGRAGMNDGASHLKISEKYQRVVMAAGGFPVVLPYSGFNNDYQAMVRQFDGLLFSGGGDIQTSLFNGIESEKVMLVDEVRDELELNLVRYARDEGIPIFGICRGIQVMNVAFGGTLYTDLKENGFDQICHDNDSDLPTSYLAHSIEIIAGSCLSSMVSEAQWMVNSSHHQGIDMLAADLAISALAPDGLVEAVELMHHPFGMGVQWHPECLPDSGITTMLMKAFVRAAACRAVGGVSSEMDGK